MSTIAPLLEAIIAYLKAQARVSDLVDTRIFGIGLPKEEITSMPRKAVVLNLAGGGALGSNDYLDLTSVRVDAIAYGTSAIEALQVQRAVHESMKAIRRVNQDGVVIWSATQSGGPVSGENPTLRSPFVFESWLILGAEHTA